MMEKPYRPKLKKCPYCNEKIAYMFKDGKKIAVQKHYEEILRWDEHTCYIDLSDVSLEKDGGKKK